MSVFTHLSAEDVGHLLKAFDAGELVSYAGIHQGVENTNYDVHTTSGRFVLTIIERRPRGAARFSLKAMELLAVRGVPAPRPRRLRSGGLMSSVANKPAALVEFLPGANPQTVDRDECLEVGTALARMHRMLSDLAPRRRNPRGAAWRHATAERVRPHLAGGDLALLDAALEQAVAFDRLRLPLGVIHADLFRDNALFVDKKLTGVLDFFYACQGALVYDLAITTLDWCRGPGGDLDSGLCQALIEGHERMRLLSKVEHRAWPAALVAAALRFWLSRLEDTYYPRPGTDIQVKDPDEFAALLRTLLARNTDASTRPEPREPGPGVFPPW